ncbi:HIT family protein [Alkalicoccus luteus]|uniref:HIT family protein n=1 Tax=Alkalicoccus luteus TaxID=1237094 RepID=A0A969PVC0_9BACI|nr:HIT family protein [Alkalicoccus luteus]NJP39046.1 HIT family protein [Alkalicoccus luteus]
MTCLGCRLALQEERAFVVYETEWVTCILDILPFNPGHVLILPKRHALDVDDLDQPTAHAVMEASKVMSRAMKAAYQPDGISIVQNGGMFNDLDHYHMHVVPRYEEQDFADFYRAFTETEPVSNEELFKTQKYLRKYVIR